MTTIPDLLVYLTFAALAGCSVSEEISDCLNCHESTSQWLWENAENEENAQYQPDMTRRREEYVTTSVGNITLFSEPW